MPNLQKVASNICSEKKKKSVMATWKKSIVAVKGSLSPKSEARLQLLSEEQIFTINCASCPSSLAAAAAKSLQLCPTLCDPIGSSPPGSPVPGILQARTLEWVAISFSNIWKWKNQVKSLSRVQLLATHGLQPTRPLCPRDFPGKSTGVGCHRLLRYPSPT